MSSPRRAAVIVAVSIAFGSIVCVLAEQQPTFRSRTLLIEFTIVAVDGRGRPIADLKPDEVTIFEDDQARDVAFFQFEGTGLGAAAATAVAPPPPAVEPLPAGIFTNRPEYTPGPPRNLTAVVLDSLNTTPQHQSETLTQVLRYLRTIPPESRLGLYRLGMRTEILHDFTRDLASLRERIAKRDVQLQPQPFERGSDLESLARGASPEKQEALSEMAISEARMLAFRNEGLRDRRLALTLASLEALGQHLAGIPGRKNLVWITDGMPIIADAAGFKTDYEPLIRRTAQRLASQGITLYPVDAKGVEALDMGTTATGRGAAKGGPPPAPRAILNRTAGEGRSWATMEVLADVTGGRLIRQTNDPTDGVTRAAEDLRASYSLGFYAVREPDNKWHGLTVKINRPGVTVRHRLGYLASSTVPNNSDATPEWSADRWRDVAFNPLGSMTVRFDVRCEYGSGQLGAALQIAAADLAFRRTADGKQITADLDVALAEKTETGPSRIGHEHTPLTLPDDPSRDPTSTLVRVIKQWPVNATTKTLRLIVRDRVTGRFGTLDIPVNACRVS